MCETEGGFYLTGGQVSTCEIVQQPITFSLGRDFLKILSSELTLVSVQSVSVAHARLYVYAQTADLCIV